MMVNSQTNDVCYGSFYKQAKDHYSKAKLRKIFFLWMPVLDAQFKIMPDFPIQVTQIKTNGHLCHS